MAKKIIRMGFAFSREPRIHNVLTLKGLFNHRIRDKCNGPSSKASDGSDYIMKKKSSYPYFYLATIISILFITSGCNNQSGPKPGDFEFPQGVASADPLPNAIILWTRVISSQKKLDSINLTLEVSKSDTFQDLNQSKNIVAKRKDDFTVRFFLDNLDSNSRYYYRFIAGKDTSRVGRTFTAPSNLELSPLNFSTLACSSYEQGFYGSLKKMIEEDKLKPESKQAKLIFHLGDFIYEVVGDDPRYDNHFPNWLTDANGNLRDIPPFPDGKQWPDSDHWKSGSWSPVTLNDYRHLYRTYLSNPVMQEARARWPFIYTWDDHEFADGNHQSETYIRSQIGMVGMQEVKVASNRAWYEYLPALLSKASDIGDIKNQAYDFRPVKVKNSPIGKEKENGLYMEPNNLKAINSMRIYRAVQWGKDILIIVTDSKSYQDPGFSVLGDRQKKWLKDLLKTSPSKWKLLLNSEPMLDAFIDYDNIDPNIEKGPVYNASWQSASQERDEILDFIQEKEITGVVSLSGDYHIQIASTVSGSKNVPVIADFAVTALSSFPDFFWLSRRGKGFDNPNLSKLYSYQNDEKNKFPNINTTVMFGAKSGLEMANTHDFNKAKLMADSSINPNLKYFDCQYNGYLTGEIINDSLNIDFVNTKNATMDHEKHGADIISKVKFEMSHWGKGEFPELPNPVIEGKVFPISY